ncbi:hypothetical protein G6X34_07200 [Staphylococcus aureus]|nr:hypothetical protein [Staphylococcus aureus]
MCIRDRINHAKEAEVPIIVAVNKIDKPTSNPDRVMQELTEYGLILKIGAAKQFSFHFLH